MPTPTKNRSKKPKPKKEESTESTTNTDGRSELEKKKHQLEKELAECDGILERIRNIQKQEAAQTKFSGHQFGSATLEVAWERMPVGSSAQPFLKQTLFRTLNEKPYKGPPEEPDEDFGLRATKAVYMYPPLVLTLRNLDGSKYTQKEEIKLSLVSANNKSTPTTGVCGCGGAPILFFQQEKKGEVQTLITTGELEFSKLQIGCLTGPRGHSSLFCLKIEFLTPGSPLEGQLLYSPPIEVGAKGPFTKKTDPNRKAMYF